MQREENDAFIYMAHHFRKQGLSVPEVYGVSDDHMAYIQEDLGKKPENILWNKIRRSSITHAFTSGEKELLRRAMRDLVDIQFRGGQDFDYSHCLAMIRLLLQPVNLLILDEPTNHLDMPSKDVLKEAIQAFEGTVIVVSHDRDFLNGIVSKVYEFGEHRVREHLGGIYDFLQKKQLDSLQQLEAKQAPVATVNEDSPEPTASQGKMDYQRQKEHERRIRQAEKKVKTCEAKIAELEQQLADIEDKLSTATSEDVDIYYKHSQISRELDDVMAQWEQASAELEKAKALR